MDLLVNSTKMTVIAAHDPVLALAAERRLVFEHGAVKAVQHRLKQEEQFNPYVKSILKQ